MKRQWTLGFVAAVLFIGGCGSSDQESSSGAPGAIPSDTRIEASDLASDAPTLGTLEYRQIVEQVFQNTGTEVSWDGVPDLAGGRSFLSVSMGQLCGEGDCGKLVFLENSNKQAAVRAVVTIPFQVQGSPGYIAREYMVSPGEKISLGCSHLCNSGEKIEFRRAIVVAKVVEGSN